MWHVFLPFFLIYSTVDFCFVLRIACAKLLLVREFGGVWQGPFKFSSCSLSPIPWKNLRCSAGRSVFLSNTGGTKRPLPILPTPPVPVAPVRHARVHAKSQLIRARPCGFLGGGEGKGPYCCGQQEPEAPFCGCTEEQAWPGARTTIIHCRNLC